MQFRAIYTFVLTLFLVIFLTQDPLSAGYVFKRGRLIDTDEYATLPVERHFEKGTRAYENLCWDDAAIQFRLVTTAYPGTSYAQEGYFYLGVSYFYLKEYDLANEAFSNYLSCHGSPHFFEETIQYKFSIGEEVGAGAKTRCFGMREFPKCMTNRTLAIEIYDEIVATVPCHDIAAHSLVAKGWLQWSWGQYTAAVEAFQQVIRRFPKHVLAPECYLMISRVYLDQCEREYQNPDILTFAELNLQKFSRNFPREERLCQVNEDFLGIQECYAKGLYEMGQYYERKRKPKAAMIYYNNAIYQFPETCISELCRDRMYVLYPEYKDTSRDPGRLQKETQEIPFIEGDLEIS